MNRTKKRKAKVKVRWDLIVPLFILTVCLSVFSLVFVPLLIPYP